MSHEAIGFVMDTILRPVLQLVVREIADWWWRKRRRPPSDAPQGSA